MVPGLMTVTVHMALSDHKKINIQKDGVCVRVRGRDDQHRLLRWRRGYPFRPGTIHKVSLGLEVKGNGNRRHSHCGRLKAQEPSSLLTPLTLNCQPHGNKAETIICRTHTLN